MAPAQRTVAGHYRLDRLIGEGGMGEVWRGLDSALEREIAVKALRPELAAKPELVERFRTEAVALAKLGHPNIAAVYNFVRDGSAAYMILEFVHGASLDKVLVERGRMPWQEVAGIGVQALAGIGQAHRQGIVHRDVKPSNLMLTPDGRVKVMDFGIARMLERSRITRDGHWVGTIEYVSPEQIRGEEVDGRADLYSLGIVLYELISGRLPYDAKTDYERMRAHLERTPTSLSRLVPDVPTGFVAVLDRALAKSPSARYADAAEFIEALVEVAPEAAAWLSPLGPDRLRTGKRSTVGLSVRLAALWHRMRDRFGQVTRATGSITFHGEGPAGSPVDRTLGWIRANALLTAAGVCAAGAFGFILAAALSRPTVPLAGAKDAGKAAVVTPANKPPAGTGSTASGGSHGATPVASGPAAGEQPARPLVPLPSSGTGGSTGVPPQDPISPPATPAGPPPGPAAPPTLPGPGPGTNPARPGAGPVAGVSAPAGPTPRSPTRPAAQPDPGAGTATSPAGPSGRPPASGTSNAPPPRVPTARDRPEPAPPAPGPVSPPAGPSPQDSGGWYIKSK